MMSTSNTSGTNFSLQGPTSGRYGQKFNEEKKTLVLALDHTLLYLTTKPESKADVSMELIFENKERFSVVKRPGLDSFLRELSSLYNICVYTAHKSKYSEKILSTVGITSYIFKIFSRNDCTKIAKGIYMKSLMKLGFALENTIFIDHAQEQIRCQPLNSILISSFQGDAEDCALDYLKSFLQEAATLDDVRPVTENLYRFFEQKNLETASDSDQSFRLLEELEDLHKIPEVGTDEEASTEAKNRYNRKERSLMFDDAPSPNKALDSQTAFQSFSSNNTNSK